MQVFEIRRENLALLLQSVKAAELARDSGVAASYISRCLKQPGQSGYKTIGELTARKLEKGARKLAGWMDRYVEQAEQHDAHLVPVNTAPERASSFEQPQSQAPPGDWPFNQNIVSQSRYEALPVEIRVIVQGALRKAIEDEEDRLAKQGAPYKAASQTR